MCIYLGHVFILTPNMKLLRLTMALGGLYTDNDTNTNSNTGTDNDGQSMIDFWLINQMSQNRCSDPEC